LPLRLIYLYKNLTRNRLRTALTTAAVALPIMIYVLAMGVVDSFQSFLDNSAKQLRLAVMHKTSIVNPLPSGHRRKIEALDPEGNRIVAVCGISWIGGQRKDDPMPLSTLAADPDTFPDCFPEHQLTPEEIEAWRRDRQAILLGRGTAGDVGWKVGDRIMLKPSVPPYDDIEFHVISTLDRASDHVSNWVRADYIDEIREQSGGISGVVTFFFVKCAGKEDLDEFRVAIDRAFTGSPDETRTLDEKAFMNEFITQQFDLPRNLRILAALTVFVAVMAAANTMSMNFRDRTNEVATLKSLGFGPGFAFALIQTESMLLCAVGGIVGIAVPYVAFTCTPLAHWTIPLIQTLEIQSMTYVNAMGVALAIGVVAAMWPSWLAIRMNVVAALRNLE
jgi:putative ABC transport system permease protein